MRGNRGHTCVCLELLRALRRRRVISFSTACHCPVPPPALRPLCPGFNRRDGTPSTFAPPQLDWSHCLQCAVPGSGAGSRRSPVAPFVVGGFRTDCRRALTRGTGGTHRRPHLGHQPPPTARQRRKSSVRRFTLRMTAGTVVVTLPLHGAKEHAAERRAAFKQGFRGGRSAGGPWLVSKSGRTDSREEASGPARSR